MAKPQSPEEGDHEGVDVYSNQQERARNEAAHHLLEGGDEGK